MLTAVIAALLWSGAVCACSAERTAGPAAEPASGLTGQTVTESLGPEASPAQGTMPAGPKWAYQLQGDVTAEIAGTSFDLVVMDYTKDGSDAPGQRYTPAEMARIKNAGVGRVVLAYLSVGEAEDYRYYFDPTWADEAAPGLPDPDAPDWLGRANPDWEGDYKVRYWSEGWQAIVLGYVEKIIAYGYDGVYLDVVDGFEYWSDPDNGEGYSLSEAEAAARMIALVSMVATHAKGVRDGFLIVPQNGERLLGYDVGGRYLAAIAGLAVEDLFYDERNLIDPAVTGERTTYLDDVLADGKPVLVVDYVYGGARDSVVERFLARATAAGYCPYAARTDRELDRLVTFPGQGT